jgi:hypothetical protein
LQSLQLLLTDPNPDDPLDHDVADEYRKNQPLFARKAREHTEKHAKSAEARAVAEVDHRTSTHVPLDAASTTPLPPPQAATQPLPSLPSLSSPSSAAASLPAPNLKRGIPSSATTDSDAAHPAIHKRSAP